MGNYKVIIEGKEYSFHTVKFMVASNGTLFFKDTTGKTVFASSATNVTVLEI